MHHSILIPSWDALIDHLRNAKPQPGWGGDHSSERVDPYLTKWAGSDSLGAAIHLAVHGCPVTRDRMEKAVAALAPEQAIEWEFAPVGVLPNIPAYAAGVPESMMFPVETERQTRIARICVNISASASIDPESIINRGAAIVALIDRLQIEGWRIELSVVDQSRHDNDTSSYRIVVKQAQEPIDMDRISFALAHPSMLRRVLFRIHETVFPRFDPGYGSPANLPQYLTDADLNIQHIDHKQVDEMKKVGPNQMVEGLWAQAVGA